MNENLPDEIDKDRIALGVRQPWAELILRGIKTVEVRAVSTQIRGPIYLYSSQRWANQDFAKLASERYQLAEDKLPLGRLIGSVDIVNVTQANRSDVPLACVPAEKLAGKFAWHLDNPVRFEEPLRVKFLPYGVWFYPFKRKKFGRRG